MVLIFSTQAAARIYVICYIVKGLSRGNSSKLAWLFGSKDPSSHTHTHIYRYIFYIYIIYQ